MRARPSDAARAGALWAVEQFPGLRSRLLASSDYELLPPGASPTEAAIPRTRESGWGARRTAARQDRAWQGLVNRAQAGESRLDIAVLLEAVAAFAPRGATVVEVGCGSAYLADLIAASAPESRYVGVDSSEAMLWLGRSHNPHTCLMLGDATSLPLGTGSVEMVIDGAALIHIPAWTHALAEYSRVSTGPIILNSVTLSEQTKSRLITKRAYGAQVLEVVFARSELLEAIEAVGRTVVRQEPSLEYDLGRYLGFQTTSELWVCE